jgi:hypothetical protein
MDALGADRGRGDRRVQRPHRNLDQVRNSTA